MDVSSANFKKWLVLNLGRQSRVIRVNTALRGTGVQRNDTEDVIVHMYRLGSAGEEV